MKTLLRVLLLTMLLAIVLAAASYWDVQRLLHRELRLSEVQRVTLPRGAPIQEAIDQLRAQGAFTNPRQWRYLRLYAHYQGLAPRIKAGDYDVAPGTNGLQFLDMLVEGKSVMSELRILEGWRASEAIALVRNHPDITQTLPDNATPEAIIAAIGASDFAAEGQFFPDTYRFTRGMKDVDLLRHAHKLLQRNLQAEWEKRAAGLPYRSPQEVLIMASIVEKETGAAIERPRIAGLFLQRLKIGMRLQTDPTVIYGLGERFDGNLRRIDLQTDTPYNSYTRDGLPPTPICLPSRAAIHAAVHPQITGELFFVSRGDGTHAFSKTLEEHNANVRRYQLGGR